MDWTVSNAEDYGVIIGIDWETAEFSPEDLLKGMLVELEHKGTTGGDPLKSAQIALDHLSESPEYYNLLEEMEKKFEKKARFMRRRFAASLEDLEAQYPALFAEVRKLEPGYSIFALPEIEKSRNPRLLLEKFAVYQVLTAHGPDVVGFNIGKFLPKVRKVAGDILEAWETGTLYDSLDELGWFGPPSDELRDPADRYYSYKKGNPMRRRRRLRQAEPTEEELLGQSDAVVKDATRVLHELYQLAHERVEILKEVLTRQKEVGDGTFMFLINDGGDYTALKELEVESSDLTKDLASFKAQHDILSDEFNRLSGGWTEEEWANRSQHGYQDRGRG